MRLTAPVMLVLALGTIACRPEDQRTETLDAASAMQKRENFPPGVAAQLDSGNAAFRADRTEDALRHYTEATELAPGIAAGWFGVFMAQHALGDEDAAKAALARAQSAASGATLIHPTTADTTR